MTPEDSSGGHVIPPADPSTDRALTAVPANSPLAPSLAPDRLPPSPLPSVAWMLPAAPVPGGLPGVPVDSSLHMPESGENPRVRWVPIAVIAFLAVLLIGAAVTVGILVANPASTDSRDTSEIGESTGVDGWGDIESRLDAKIEQYKTARDDGSLWQQIPATPQNDTAVTAFLFFLTDMKIAASFGVDGATAASYAEEARVLEERLLAEEPLGSDIEIAFSEDRIFRYDGETGEGGYFTE